MNVTNANNNFTFGAKLGGSAKFYLRNEPEKLRQITKNIAAAGRPDTVVDIMSARTSKGKMYSLRLFNEKYGEWCSMSLLKDNYNKDMLKGLPKDLFPALENLKKSTIEVVERNLLNKLSN